MTGSLGARLIGIGFIAALGAAVFYVETHREIAHFRLFTFSLIFISLVITTAVIPERLRSVGLLLTSLALGITAVEATAQAMEPKSDLTGVLDTEIRVPILGWDNGAAGSTKAGRVNLADGTSVYDVTYTIDTHHDRLTKSSTTGRNLVFLGDSFTFGTGVNDSETMPQRFADLLGGRQRVSNLGVGGYSPAQVLAELQNGLKDDVIGKDPLAFVMLTGPFHVVRTACKESWTIRAPRYEKRDGRLVFVGACAEGAAAAFRRFLEATAAYRVFVKPLRLHMTHHDVETYIDIVAEVVRTAKAKFGVETIVPYIGGPVSSPKSLQHRQMKLLPIWAYLPGTGYDDDKIIAELRARGVTVVDATLRDEVMSGHSIGIPGDGHPSPFAHARRAELILAALKSMGIPLAGTEHAPAPHVSGAAP